MGLNGKFVNLLDVFEAQETLTRVVFIFLVCVKEGGTVGKVKDS